LYVNSLGDGVTYPQRCIDEDTDTLLGGCQRWDDQENGCSRWNDPEEVFSSIAFSEPADSDSSTVHPEIMIVD